MAILDDNRMFGDIFRELRNERELSQDKIALELKVSQGLIAKWENQATTPSPEMLDYIADYFDVSTDYLIGRTTDKRCYLSNKDNTIVNKLYNLVRELPEYKQKVVLNVTQGIMEEVDKELDQNKNT